MAAAQLNGCEYLYLRELSEPEDNSIRLLVLEAKPLAGPAAESIAGPVSGARPIEHFAGCRVFEIEWGSYVAYSVRNESFARTAEGEEFEGRLFRLFSKSRYLDYVAAATIASPDYPGPFRHWALVCLNHVIDVVSVVEPAINVDVAA